MSPRPASALKELGFLDRFLHIFGIYGLAVVVPLLTFLGDEAPFWVARRARWVDVIVFLTLLLLVPVVLTLVGHLLARLNAKVGDWFLTLLVVSLSFLAASPLVDHLVGTDTSSRWTVVSVSVISIVTGFFHWRYRLVHKGFEVLAAGSIALILVFVVQLPGLGEPYIESDVLGESSTTSVILLVLDELNAGTLLDADGEIDGDRFPSFKRLSERATFYRNAYASSDSTLSAIPAVLSGLEPEEERHASLADYPENLFTLLAATHEMNVDEGITRLCPTRVCGAQESTVERVRLLLEDASVIWLHRIAPAAMRDELPPLGLAWEGFMTDTREKVPTVADGYAEYLVEQTGGERRAFRYGEFLDRIRTGGRPTLSYLHLELPHPPWEYGQSGERYVFSDWIAGLESGGLWSSNRWHVLQAYQRYDTQLQYTDALLRLLLDELSAQSAWDRTLLVVMADHGANFEVGEPRRDVTAENVGSIASVPLFISYPGQAFSSLQDAPTLTLDVLPTILDVVYGKSIAGLDGRSLVSGEPRSDGDSHSIGEVNLTFGELRRRAAEDSLSMARIREERDFEGLILAGPHPELVGRSPDGFQVEPASGSLLELEWPELYLDLAEPEFPAPSMVRAHLGGEAEGEVFAIAVNGTIWATLTKADNVLAALLPMTGFEASGNRVQIYAVEHRGDEVLLRGPIG